MKHPKVKFIPTEELKCTFDVFGLFYSVQDLPKQVVECRNVFEIVASDHVPMNPDSSRPLSEKKNSLVAKAIHELPISLVPTKRTFETAVDATIPSRAFSPVIPMNLIAKLF